MNEKPLRLIIFALLYLINLILSIPDFPGVVAKKIELLPPEAIFWVNLTVDTYILVFLLLLIGTVWLENPIAYILSMVFIGAEIAYFFMAYPQHPLTYFILEILQLALLLSLIKHFFKR